MPDGTETPATVLRAAAERIRTQGLSRGGYREYRSGAVCALGAIYDVQREDIGKVDLKMRAAPPAFGAARSALESLVNDHIPIWNDHIAADGEEVAAAMEKAAAQWEERNA